MKSKNDNILFELQTGNKKVIAVKEFGLGAYKSKNAVFRITELPLSADEHMRLKRMGTRFQK